MKESENRIPHYREIPAPSLPVRFEFSATIALHNNVVAEQCQQAGEEREVEYSVVDNDRFKGDWGYSQKRPCIVCPEMRRFASSEGVYLEHIFVRRRVYEELILNKYDGRPEMECLRFYPLKQSLLGDGARRFDKLEVLVTGYKPEDVEFLRNDLAAHDGYFGDAKGMKAHEALADTMRIGYKAIYWFDITDFFGKGEF